MLLKKLDVKMRQCTSLIIFLISIFIKIVILVVAKDISNAVEFDLCSFPKIDAITRTRDGKTFVFKGKFFWRIGIYGIHKGYPKLINDKWPGLPDDIDAALTWRSGRTLFFKGDSYWAFENQIPLKGYPKKIRIGFIGIPDDIDAAFLWSGNAVTYFFKGNQYWKLDSRFDENYPRNISVWKGIPNNLDAAFQWEDSRTYFFKGTQYFGFDDTKFQMLKMDKDPYPRETAHWWFSCKMNTTTVKNDITTDDTTKDVFTTVVFTESVRTQDTQDMVKDSETKKSNDIVETSSPGQIIFNSESDLSSKNNAKELTFRGTAALIALNSEVSTLKSTDEVSLTEEHSTYVSYLIKSENTSVSSINLSTFQGQSSPIGKNPQDFQFYKRLNQSLVSNNSETKLTTTFIIESSTAFNAKKMGSNAKPHISIAPLNSSPNLHPSFVLCICAVLLFLVKTHVNLIIHK